MSAFIISARKLLKNTTMQPCQPSIHSNHDREQCQEEQLFLRGTGSTITALRYLVSTTQEKESIGKDRAPGKLISHHAVEPGVVLGGVGHDELKAHQAQESKNARECALSR